MSFSDPATYDLIAEPEISGVNFANHTEQIRCPWLSLEILQYTLANDVVCCAAMGSGTLDLKQFSQAILYLVCFSSYILPQTIRSIAKRPGIRPG